MTIHSNKDATFEMYSFRELRSSITKSLESKLSSHTSPRSTFKEYSFLINAQINEGGPSPEDNALPPSLFSYERKITAFNKLSLYEKQQDIPYWMKTDILPILAYYEINVDSLYAGILNVGSLLNEGEFLQEN